MKKRGYAAVPVETRETIDIHSGEVSQMPMRTMFPQPDYGTLYLAAYDKIGDDPRMTLTAWRVFAKLIGHLTLKNNHADITHRQLMERTGLSRQSITEGLAILRTVGALAPSQAFGKYHLHVNLIYRGKGLLRASVRERQARGRQRRERSSDGLRS